MLSKPKARDSGFLNLKKEGNLAIAWSSWKEVRKINVSTPFIYSTISGWCLSLSSAGEPEEPINALPESAFQRSKQKVIQKGRWKITQHSCFHIFMSRTSALVFWRYRVWSCIFISRKNETSWLMLPDS